MRSVPGSPFGLEDKALPEPPGCFILEDLQTLHKHETRGLDTIQATSFFPWLATFSSFKKSLRQREICEKILKSGKILRNHRPDEQGGLQIVQPIIFVQQSP